MQVRPAEPSDMQDVQFDPAETIAGFPLKSIRRALGWMGLMGKEGDNVERVAKALSCPLSQAEHVLAAAERRGLVTPTGVKNHWKTTDLGWNLVMRWKPPPRIEPAISLDGDDDPKAINEVFDEVPCSLLRTTPDDDDAFEEAKLEVGVFVEYASPRVIEISVSIPDDWDYPDDSASIESSVYVGVEDAKRFMKALQTSIERAEKGIARRKRMPPAKSRRAEGDEERRKGPKGTGVLKRAPMAPSKDPAAVARDAAKAEAKADAVRRKEERAARTGVDAIGVGRVSYSQEATRLSPGSSPRR